VPPASWRQEHGLEARATHSSTGCYAVAIVYLAIGLLFVMVDVYARTGRARFDTTGHA
jgi:hypothetical protein